MKKLLMLLSFLLPWSLRYRMLEAVFGWSIHPSSHIGLAWVFPRRLVMGEGASIGHLTLCKNLDLLELGPFASIGRGNWITGYPSDMLVHFLNQKNRCPQLILGAHAAITNRHIIDCTDSVTIGDFSTFAGFASQILTHSIDLESCRQSCAPVEIGRYCFVGTACVLLSNSCLPDYSVLGAKSLLNKSYTESHWLYGGVPARPIKPLSVLMPYFSRKVGFII